MEGGRAGKGGGKVGKVNEREGREEEEMEGEARDEEERRGRGKDRREEEDCRQHRPIHSGPDKSGELWSCDRQPCSDRNKGIPALELQQGIAKNT